MSLAGRDIQPTAPKTLHPSLSVACDIRGSIAFDVKVVTQVPKTCPFSETQIRDPLWDLLECHRNHNTQNSWNSGKSYAVAVAGEHHLPCLFPLIDFPGQGPGLTLGPPSVSVNPRPLPGQHFYPRGRHHRWRRRWYSSNFPHCRHSSTSICEGVFTCAAVRICRAHIGIDASQRPLPDEAMKGRLRRRHCPRRLVTIKLEITCFCTRACLLSSLPISSYFRIQTPRTSMIQLRSRDTKMVRTRSTSLLKYLCHHTSNLEAPGSISRPHNH
jgi:hypothetical protein